MNDPILAALCRRILKNLPVWIGLLSATVLLGLPFYWMIVTAFKPLREVMLYPPAWIPGEWHWQNFVYAWQAAPFGRFFINSILVSTVAALLQVTFAVMMAYAFVFIRFPFRRVIFLFVLVSMAVPEEVKLIPNFLLITRLGWVNTYAGLIVPVVAHAFPVFVMTQWFRIFPRDLVEAAKVDGAGHLHTLLSVVLPASRPILVVLMIFSFVNRWNDYLWPLIATNEVSMRTLSIGLAYLRSTQEGGGRWELLMAAALLAMLPLVGLFFFFQNQITGEVLGLFRQQKT